MVQGIITSMMLSNKSMVHAFNHDNHLPSARNLSRKPVLSNCCMKIATFLLLTVLFATASAVYSQPPLYAKYTSLDSREKLHRGMVEHAINKNLSTVLTDSTEEMWQDAFYTLELLLFRSPWVDKKIHDALSYLPRGGYEFKRSMLEVLYTNYKGQYTKEIALFAQSIADPKLFSIAMEYVLADTMNKVYFEDLQKLVQYKYGTEAFDNPVLQSLLAKRKLSTPRLTAKMFDELFDKAWLPDNVVMFSFQRKNRDYPGLVIIRDTTGELTRTQDGKLFSVPHLARSISSLPFYLTNGNTPQGIFRMSGFAISKSQAIGPSPNIQMEMPVECSISKFMNESTILDSVWNVAWYESLLPASMHKYFPLYESYYAGAAGRSEIIAHGTTVDPKYYEGKPYYPHTPSLGCLTTSETWNEQGMRAQSNQQKLIDALAKAGGAHGYCLVIELDDKQEAVSIEDINRIIPRTLKAK